MPIVTDELELDFPEFDRTLRKFAKLRNHSLDKEFQLQAAGALKRAVMITPPFNPRDRKVSGAKKAGEAAIGADMRRIFAPVEIVGSRKITHLFGKILHPDIPWTTPETEKHPDVANLLKKAPRKGSGKLVYRKQKYYVDKRKFEQIRKQRVKEVGKLGGGWATGAQKLQMKGYPAFMRRHAGKSPGSVHVDLKPPDRRIAIKNQVKYGTSIPSVGRRIAYAVEYQRKAMERQIPYLIRKAAREARFAD